MKYHFIYDKLFDVIVELTDQKEISSITSVSYKGMEIKSDALKELIFNELKEDKERLTLLVENGNEFDI